MAPGTSRRFRSTPWAVYPVTESNTPVEVWAAAPPQAAARRRRGRLDAIGPLRINGPVGWLWCADSVVSAPDQDGGRHATSLLPQYGGDDPAHPAGGTGRSLR